MASKERGLFCSGRKTLKRAYLVVIPLVEDWSLGEKALHLIVSEIVFPVRSELIKSHSNEVLGWIVGPCADVLAIPSVCDVLAGCNGVICIDHVTFGYEQRKEN